jgi:hypothetical protein
MSATALNRRHSKRAAARSQFAALGLALVLLAGLCPQPAEAQSSRARERRVERSLAAKDAIRHRQMKRAYVAGAVAQHRRERIRDHYEERYYRDRHERYDRRDDDDDDLSRVLIGVAVGAVATSIIMNSNQDGGAR